MKRPLDVYLITETLGMAVEPLGVREVERDARAITYRFESDVFLVERESPARPWCRRDESGTRQ